MAIGLAVVTALLCAALWFYFWRRRRIRLPTRVRRIQPSNAVVLAHGILGFSELKAGRFRGDYFRKVPERLRKLGNEVYALDVPRVASIAVRAEHLKRGIEQLSAKQVNIIAHSMGGLDARYAISRLGLANRVVSLTTVGTPHHGTPIADLGTGLLGDRLGMRRVLSALGVGMDAFYDLTTLRMSGFNRDTPDMKGVAYACYLGSVKGKLRVNPLLLPSYLFLNERAGENDGLVPSVSQRWGDVLGTIEADHWAQIGWSPGFDAPEFYAELLRELRGRGF